MRERHKKTILERSVCGKGKVLCRGVGYEEKLAIEKQLEPCKQFVQMMMQIKAKAAAEGRGQNRLELHRWRES